MIKDFRNTNGMDYRINNLLKRLHEDGDLLHLKLTAIKNYKTEKVGIGPVFNYYEGQLARKTAAHKLRRLKRQN